MGADETSSRTRDARISLPPAPSLEYEEGEDQIQKKSFCSPNLINHTKQFAEVSVRRLIVGDRTMNKKILAPLGLAAVLGLAAAFVARSMIANRPAQSINAESLLRTVVVANTNILPGSEIDASMVTSAKVSQEMAPDDTFTDVGDVTARVVQGPIYKGQPIIGTLLAPKGSPGGLGTLIPKGMRAITIQIDEFSGVGGFLTPGCRVDLISTMTGESNGDMIARSVVQNILVTAVGQRMTLKQENGQEGASRSVTMIATPEEAQAIELAATTGRPRLVLRNVRDEAKSANEGVSLSDLKGSNRNKAGEDPFGSGHATAIEYPPAFPVTANPSTQPSDRASAGVYNVKIIRAGNETEVQFPLPTTNGNTVPVNNNRNEPITQTDGKVVGN